MLRSAGETWVSAGAVGPCANPPTVPRISSRKAAIRFMTILSLSFEFFEKKFVAASSCSGHETGLFHRADIVSLATATPLSGTDMVAVTSAVSRFHPRERSAIAHIVQLHAVADTRAVFRRVDQNATHGTSGDIDH